MALRGAGARRESDRRNVLLSVSDLQGGLVCRRAAPASVVGGGAYRGDLRRAAFLQRGIDLHLDVRGRGVRRGISAGRREAAGLLGRDRCPCDRKSGRAGGEVVVEFGYAKLEPCSRTTKPAVAGRRDTSVEGRGGLRGIGERSRNHSDEKTTN